MGWLTEKPVIWELKKGWVPLICLIFPILLVFGIWYMGKKAKMEKMMKGLIGVGILFALIVCNLIFVIIAKSNNQLIESFFISVSVLVIGSSLFYSVILLAANTKEYLQRIHLQEFMVLEWEEYNYLSLVNNKQIREVKTLSSFIEELKRWDEMIVDEAVSDQIVDLITLMSKVNSIKEGQTALFIERHVFSLTSLLKQFHQVELSKLTGSAITRIKQKLRHTLDIALKAIRQEILDEMQQQNRMAEVEADLYIESLRNEGLL